jgi:hypothetical protein
MMKSAYSLAEAYSCRSRSEDNQRLSRGEERVAHIATRYDHDPIEISVDNPTAQTPELRDQTRKQLRHENMNHPAEREREREREREV